MTTPREILPGRTYLITRRCTQRQLLLKPSRLTNQMVRYCLGVAAQQTGILVHAVCFMSNHWHGVVTDPAARLPEFLERFHRLLARAQNASLGRWENFWSSDKTSVVRLVSDQDVLDKMAYTIANPTLAGLVRSPHEWPGVNTLRISERQVVRMPDVFFDPGGSLPETVTIAMERPPIFNQLDGRTLAIRLRCAIEKLVREARLSLRRRGQRFLGVRAILQQAATAMPVARAQRRTANPQIAAKDTCTRVMALRALLQFRRAYRLALDAWRSGRRDVVFPAGTYALRVYAHVACAPWTPS